MVTGAGFGGEYAGGFAGLVAGGLRLSGGFHTGNLAVSKTESNSSLGIPEGAELWEASDPATDPGVSRPRLWSRCDLWSPWCASCFLSRGCGREGVNPGSLSEGVAEGMPYWQEDGVLSILAVSIFGELGLGLGGDICVFLLPSPRSPLLCGC